MDVIYPPVCPVCGRPAPVAERKRLEACPECVKKIIPVEDACMGLGIVCQRCGKQVKNDEEFCYDCKRYRHIFDQGAAAFVYTADIKNSIYRYKYADKREYASWYARRMYECCGRKIHLWEPDVIIPVPLHEKKLKMRGYNQAELLARELSLLTGIKTDSKLLVRQKNTKALKTLDESERIKNLKNAFNITRDVVKYKKVLLVDDIYTTGATADGCAAVLKQAGAERVYILSICIGDGI